MSDNYEITLATGWEVKLLAVSAAAIAVCLALGLVLGWDAIQTADAAVESLDGLKRAIEGTR